MFATGPYNPTPMGFQYPGQQPLASIYQSQFAGFNPTLYQQVPPPPASRGQSLPASARQYPPPSGTYGPIPPRRNGQYPPPQNYEHHTHGSKKNPKQRSVSPTGVADQSLYSDKEKDDRSRSQSPTLASQTKEGATLNQEQHSQGVDNTSGEVSQAAPIVGDEQQNSSEKEKRKSRSKKKKHHRHEQQHQQYQPPPPPPPPLYGELPFQVRVHHQPLYNGYNQAYEESIRRGDVYHKQTKRAARLPQEAKQQLLPHEGDQKRAHPFPGYPQQPFRPPYNPYQAGFYPRPTPYNTPPTWGNIGGINPKSAEQEIQRLRSHIHSLEGELQKLQKKLSKASIDPEDSRRSPRQTPVIVELNNTEANRESSSKKKHRQGSVQNAVQSAGENLADQNASNQPSADLRERSRSGGNQLSEGDGKLPLKTSREETAAQLAHAAAALVHARQQVPPPPPVQQQYLYQQGVFPLPPQQIRPNFPGNVQPPTDPYQQRNFNQSNNTELVDKEEERRNRRSADKILDAFERFYMTKTTTTPLKVKYIPEDNISNHSRNTNNNNSNYRDRSRTPNLAATSN